MARYTGGYLRCNPGRNTTLIRRPSGPAGVWTGREGASRGVREAQVFAGAKLPVVRRSSPGGFRLGVPCAVADTKGTREPNASVRILCTSKAQGQRGQRTVSGSGLPAVAEMVEGDAGSERRCVLAGLATPRYGPAPPSSLLGRRVCSCCSMLAAKGSRLIIEPGACKMASSSCETCRRGKQQAHRLCLFLRLQMLVFQLLTSPGGIQFQSR